MCALGLYGVPLLFPSCLSQGFGTPWVFAPEGFVGFELRLEGVEFGFDFGFHWSDLSDEQIPDGREGALAGDSHAVFTRHDLTDFFELSFGHGLFLCGFVFEQADCFFEGADAVFVVALGKVIQSSVQNFPHSLCGVCGYVFNHDAFQLS